MAPDSEQPRDWTDHLPLMLMGALVGSLITVATALINMNTKVEVLVNNSKADAAERAELKNDHKNLEDRVTKLEVNDRAVRMVVRLPNP